MGGAGRANLCSGHADRPDPALCAQEHHDDARAPAGWAHPEGSMKTGDNGAQVLPTVVIGGYLGAGKTTLVNHLLRHAGAAAQSGGRRIAVLVNDFGEISIDADLIEGAAGEVLSLAGGCICCSFGADLVGTLAAVAQRVPRPELVLIETSGVGLPASVARTAKLVPGVRIDGIVVLADALALRRQASERFVGDTVRQQLHEADLVIVGKTDLVDAPALDALLAWLREDGVTAPCMPLPVALQERAAAICAWVLGLAGLEEPTERGERIADRRAPPYSPKGNAGAAHGMRRVHGVAPAAERHATQTRRFAEPVDVAALGEALRAQGVLRAKGLLLDLGGQWHELQVAGGRIDLRVLPRPPAAEDGDGAGTPGAPDALGAAGRLVTITRRED